MVLRTTTRELALADIIGESCMGLGAGSTVMLQLALRPVGLGVAEHSATLNRPLDRLRTTATFVMCMVLGTEAERQAVARMVNKAHVPVRSAEYDAFDPDAQLWVAATLARNSEAMYERTFGPLPEASRERIYRDSWVFGTVLQVSPDMWPPTRAEFEDYWISMQSKLSAGPEVQDYARRLLTTRGKPLVAKPLMPLQSLMTRGNLTPEQRALLGLPWTARDQKRYDLFWRFFPRIYRRIPRPVRTFGARVNLFDMRLRMKLGRRVI